MKKRRLYSLTTTLLATAILLATTTPLSSQESPVLVLLQTSLGEIQLQIDVAHAPRTARNFLTYVRARSYDDGTFHRTVKPDNQPDKKVKIEVVQAGPREATVDMSPIPLERTSVTGLHHLDGTISMARDGPDTATSDFFICIGNQPELDFGGRRNPDGQGFAAFGQVVQGMELVRRIQAAPCQDQTLQPPISILKASIQHGHFPASSRPNRVLAEES